MQIIDGIDVYNEDCLPAMRKMLDGAFDLAIVDPPYGIGWDKENLSMSLGLRKDGSKRQDSTWRAKRSIQKYKLKNWDKKRPNGDFFSELLRVSKKSIIWGGNYFTDYLQPSGGWVIWDKKKPEGWSLSDCELAWCSFGGSAKIFRHLWHGYGKEEPEVRIHPTQKPVKLYEWILKNYAKEGDRILDTHLGSGSIAIACYNMGFELTAFEIDKDYYEDAVKRIRKRGLEERNSFGLTRPQKQKPKGLIP